MSSQHKAKFIGNQQCKHQYVWVFFNFVLFIVAHVICEYLWSTTIDMQSWSKLKRTKDKRHISICLLIYYEIISSLFILQPPLTSPFLSLICISSSQTAALWCHSLSLDFNTSSKRLKHLKHALITALLSQSGPNSLWKLVLVVDQELGIQEILHYLRVNRALNHFHVGL